MSPRVILTSLRLTHVLHIRKYLSDPTEDVRIATENLLADFLREIREVSLSQKRYEEQSKLKRGTHSPENMRATDYEQEKLPDITLSQIERAAFIPENGEDIAPGEEIVPPEDGSEKDYRDNGIIIICFGVACIFC